MAVLVEFLFWCVVAGLAAGVVFGGFCLIGLLSEALAGSEWAP